MRSYKLAWFKGCCMWERGLGDAVVQACSSVAERCLNMAEVGGSIPSAPTKLQGGTGSRRGIAGVMRGAVAAIAAAGLAACAATPLPAQQVSRAVSDSP